MTPADFRALTYPLPDACLLVTAAGDVLGANPAAQRLTGLDRTEIEGQDLLDLVSDDRADVRAYLSSASRTRGPITGALTFSAEEELPCSCLGGVVEPPDGDRSARLLLRLRERASTGDRFRLLDEQIDRLTREIRRRHQAEREQARLLERESETRAELERSRALLEESQRSARVGSWEWEVRTEALTWSDELYRVFGLDPDGKEITFERCVELIHPDDRDLVLETLARSAEDVDSFAFEHRIVRPGGKVRVIHSRGRPITDPDDGTVLRLIGSAQDITERKRKEERVRFLAEAGHVLTSSLDYEKTLRRVAELAVPRMADWSSVDLLQDGEIRRVAVAHPDPDKREIAEEVARRWPVDLDDPGGVAQVLRTGDPLLLEDLSEAFLREAARSEEHLELLRTLGLRSAMIVPMEARDQTLGAITFVAAERERGFGNDDLAFALDLADRAALAIDNARLYRDAQEATRARDELMAIVSHDLRNPLNTVLAAADLLVDAPLPDEKREQQYGAIRRSARRMQRLTGDLLDLTRIEAGHLNVDPRPVEVRPLAEEALQSATSAADRTGVCLASEVDDELPPVLGDRDRLHQVLDNLLSNAIRHTPEGGKVTLGVEAMTDGVRFRVSDTGPGIPPEIRDRVFDRYCQAGRPDHGGAGLGLPIAKGIVDAHGGRIWLEPETDRGTTFAFVLPAASDGEENGGAVVA